MKAPGLGDLQTKLVDVGTGPHILLPVEGVRLIAAIGERMVVLRHKAEVQRQLKARIEAQVKEDKAADQEWRAAEHRRRTEVVKAWKAIPWWWRPFTRKPDASPLLPALIPMPHLHTPELDEYTFLEKLREIINPEGVHYLSSDEAIRLGIRKPKEISTP